MANGSTRRFGIVSNLSGLSQGVLVNNISVSNNYQTAQARNEKGQIIDIATYSQQKQFSINGLYVSSGVAVGSKVKVNDQTFLVTNTSISETNNDFLRMSINARLCPDQELIPIDPAQFGDALMFKAVNDIGGVALNYYGSPTSIEIKYKKNYGEWTTYTLGDSIILNKNDIVAFSGTNDHLSLDSSNYYYFTVAGDIEASGNVQSLMNFSDSVGEYDYYRLFYNCSDLKTAPQLAATNLAVNCYDSMFYGCTSISTPPALPAETVAAGCYQYMFANCTSLEDAPSLIADSVESACYQGMFAGCTSITEAPTLYANTLATDCYKEMFSGCSNLDKIVVFFDDWGTNNTQYTTDWMVGTAEDGTFVKVEQLSTIYGTNNIPTEWNVVDMGYDPPEPPDPPPTSSVGSATIIITDFPNINWDFETAAISSINLNDYVTYDGEDALVYTTSPSLPNGVVLVDGVLSANKDLMNSDVNGTYTITISADDAETPVTTTISIVIENVSEEPQPEDYSTMPLTFRSTGDTAIKIDKPYLSYSKNGGAWQSYDLSYISMNDGDEVSFSGINDSVETSFSISGDGTLQVYGNPHSLINWGDLTYRSCFEALFQGCTQLVDASNLILPATTLTNDCYDFMFDGCTALTAAPQLPATELASYCYQGMFAGTALTSAPYLPATTLAEGCYSAMFEGCSSLSTAPQLPASTLAFRCYRGMFEGCTSLTSIDAAFTEWEDESTDNWVYNVAASGTFYKTTALSTYRGDNYIPNGWTIVNK